MENKINLENAPLSVNIMICLVTGIDISSQRKGSKFLSVLTLKKLKETHPDIYKTLEKKYLTKKANKLTIEIQLYRICKNIRNKDSNPRNNKKKSIKGL